MPKKLSEEQLDALIEEATVDCYDDYEARAGFFTVLEDNLTFPFKATVIGEEVEVIGIEQEDERIDAVCKRKRKKYQVDILNLKYKSEEVKGYEWIEAYRKWV